MSSLSRIYVGNLPTNIIKFEIEELFYKFGRVTEVDLKTHYSPPFAFVQFDDHRSAEKAVKLCNGMVYERCKLRVERRRISNPGNYGASRNRRGDQRPPRSDFCVKVTDLPDSGSWQDLKDHMRLMGIKDPVGRVNVYRNGTAIVEFSSPEQVQDAINRLDDSRFQSHRDDVSYIRVRELPPENPYGGDRRRPYTPPRSRRRCTPGPRSRSRSRFRS